MDSTLPPDSALLADLRDEVAALQNKLDAAEGKVADLSDELAGAKHDGDQVEDLVAAVRGLIDWCDHGQADRVFLLVLKVQEAEVRDALRPFA